MSDVFKEQFEYNERPCRVTLFVPKKCTCGDCERDFDLCDILFTDNLEFKRHVHFEDLKKNSTNSTDSNIKHEDVLPETPKV